MSVVSSILHLSIPFLFTLRSIILACILGIIVPLLSAIPSITAMLESIRKERHSGNEVVGFRLLLLIRLSIVFSLQNKQLFSLNPLFYYHF